MSMWPKILNHQIEDLRVIIYYVQCCMYSTCSIAACTVPVHTHLHEQHVGNVELPGVVLAAELDALAEDLLHLSVVLHVPVDLGLRHQHRDVAGMEWRQPR